MKMILSFLSVLLLFPIFGMEITQSNFQASHKIGNVKLFHKDDGFYVQQQGIDHKVKSHWIDKDLKKMSRKQLQAFLGKGYITINQFDNQDFALKAKVRGLGGGPWLAYLGYGAMKGTLYGVLGAGITTMAATAIVAAPVIGSSAAATAATTSLVGSAMGATALGTATAAAAPAAVAAVVGTSAAATAVAVEVTMAATCTMGVAATVTTVEAISLGFGALLAAIPGPI